MRGLCRPGCLSLCRLFVIPFPLCWRGICAALACSHLPVASPEPLRDTRGAYRCFFFVFHFPTPSLTHMLRDSSETMHSLPVSSHLLPPFLSPSSPHTQALLWQRQWGGQGDWREWNNFGEGSFSKRRGSFVDGSRSNGVSETEINTFKPCSVRKRERGRERPSEIDPTGTTGVLLPLLPV